MSGIHEQRTTGSINTDGSVTSHQALPLNSIFQSYPDQGMAYSNGNIHDRASLDKDQTGDEGMMFRTYQGLGRDAFNSFGFDGLDYLFENLGSENYVLNFV